ncbi:hypothetical protein Hdeb2414_s0027g00687301 [Helianthus debilis subsp. tardiflorus]
MIHHRAAIYMVKTGVFNYICSLKFAIVCVCSISYCLFLIFCRTYKLGAYC